MGDVRCRLTVSGRVQGVYYRDSCRSVATGLGVRGWVRNLADGSVEVVVEGPRDAVEEMIEWCRVGPPRAEVTGVEISDEAPSGEPGFRVR
ncbi:MAG: acylphosphatase [Ilumatobacteraceae bacterium]